MQPFETGGKGKLNEFVRLNSYVETRKIIFFIKNADEGHLDICYVNNKFDTVCLQATPLI